MFEPWNKVYSLSSIQKGWLFSDSHDIKALKVQLLNFENAGIFRPFWRKTLALAFNVLTCL